MIGTTKTTMQMDGLDGLMQLLRDLPPNVVGKLVKPAMTEAGKLLKGQLYNNALRQRRQAEARGYRRKTGVHLSDTTAARAKMYKKNNVTFVAVGFDYKAGGFHAHLVELGHRIVHGGSLEKKFQHLLPNMTAAGQRHLTKMGWTKGDWESGVVLKGKRKGKPRILKGSWKDATGSVRAGGSFGREEGGVRVRGGGTVAGMTRKFPMLGPAFQTMARPMIITIENELKKIGPEAVRLAQNKQKKNWRWISSSSR